MLPHPDHAAQVEKEKRGGEQDGIDEVESTADAREEAAGVFGAGRAFDDGLGEVADDGREAEAEPENEEVEIAEGAEPAGLLREEGAHGEGAAGGKGERAEEAFPSLVRRDVRDEGRAADER